MTRDTDGLTRTEFKVESIGEGDERVVAWEDERMFPYECDGCGEWVDEPNERGVFRCFVVVAAKSKSEIATACSKECCVTVRDGRQVEVAIEKFGDAVEHLTAKCPGCGKLPMECEC